MSFNLCQAPWIPVVTHDRCLYEISLLELFRSWDSFHDIQADNPPTTLAIYRFLLAILHHVYQGPENEEHWVEIQEDNGEAAIAYLQNNTKLFDILDPHRPFLQDPTIPWEQSAEIYQAYTLQGNNTSTVFCHDHQWSGNALPFPAAARLVLRLHLFDVGGRKTGSSTSAGVIPTMDAANVLVKGKTLQETVLLNLMQYDGKETPCVVIGTDLPSWEQEPSPPKERIPNGYIDYLTFQWRRVRLFVGQDHVIRVAFHSGDRLPKDVSPSQWECGIAYSKNPKGLLTVRLNLSRSIWRDSAAFLQSSNGSHCPRIIQWLAELQTEKLIDNRLNLQVLGLNVDNAKPLGWTSEQLSVPILYLKEKPLWQALEAALHTVEEHQQVFRSFKGSPYHALKDTLNYPDAGQLAKSLDGESRYWATLDQLFPLLLIDLMQDKTVDGNGTTYGKQVLQNWMKSVQSVAKQSFTDSIAPIRNYQARADALRSLNFQLAKLRGEMEGKPNKGKGGKNPSKKMEPLIS